MTVRTEPSEKWVRGWLDGEAVVDTRSAWLVWEDPFPVPVYAIDPADVQAGVLTPAAGPPSGIPFFFGPKGPVAQWFDIRAAGREINGAAWQLADPAVADRVIVSWQPGVLDRWTEEEEEVGGHPRDPHKRVEAIAGSRHVQVSVGGTVLAESHRPVLLFETDLPTRYYLPPDDVDLTVLTPGHQQSHCPYKGVADKYWDLPNMPESPGPTPTRFRCREGDRPHRLLQRDGRPDRRRRRRPTTGVAVLRPGEPTRLLTRSQRPPLPTLRSRALSFDGGAERHRGHGQRDGDDQIGAEAADQAGRCERTEQGNADDTAPRGWV